MRSVLLVLALVSAFPNWSSAQDLRVSQARSLLREASGLIKENPDSQQESAAANVASQLARSGDLVDALNTAHLLKPELQGLAISCVAWQLAHGGNADLALSLIDSMKAGDGRDMAYVQVSQALGQKGDMDQAMIAVHRIADPSRVAAALVQIAILQAKAGGAQEAGASLDEALEQADEYANRNVNNGWAYLPIVQAHSQIGDVPQVFMALNRLEAIAEEQKAKTGQTALLDALAINEASIGDLAKATEILQELPHADSAYMGLADSLAQRGVMAEAIAAAENVSDSNNKDIALREIAIARRSIDVNDSFAAIDEMSSPWNRSEALGVLALQLAEDENPAAYQALQRWHELKASFNVKDDKGEEMTAVTYGVLGDFESAGKILNSIEKPDGRTWPLWNLTQFLVNKERPQETFSLIEQEQAAYPKIYALLGTAQGLLDVFESETAANQQRKTK